MGDYGYSIDFWGRWRDSADHNQQKLTTLELDEFLRRFLLHVLPKGFVRIRNFGFLANRRRVTLLPVCRQTLAVLPPSPVAQDTSSAQPAPPLWLCPNCCNTPSRNGCGGWREIEVVDDDLGRPAAGTVLPPALNVWWQRFVGQGGGSGRAGDRRQIERHQGVSASVHDSLSRGREVDSLAHALPDFLEPHPGTGAVNHAPQKAQPLGCIIAVPPDVVLRDLGVQS